MIIDAESLARHYNIEFVDDAAMIHRTIHRPPQPARNCYLLSDVLERLRLAESRTNFKATP